MHRQKAEAARPPLTLFGPGEREREREMIGIEKVLLQCFGSWNFGGLCITSVCGSCEYTALGLFESKGIGVTFTYLGRIPSLILTH